jgi:paraquat-inducible protein B
VQQEFREALQELTSAARALRVLVDFLERHPDSLLKGKKAAPMPKPEARPAKNGGKQIQ